MRRFVVPLVVTCIVLSGARQSNAVPIPGVASSIGKAILKYFGKEGTEQASEYLGRKGGQEILERVASNAAKQGGDGAVENVAKLAGKHGPEALAALDNSPSIMPVITALEEIPESQVRFALAKLAAGESGRELAETISRFGAVALRSELKHPGVGMILVRSLGDEGADLATRLSGDQAIAVARHADDLAKLPDAQRAGILGMLKSDTDRMVAFVGRFVEANPGKSLFTVATTTVILAQPERILGGDEVVFDADGNPIVVSKLGVVGRTMEAGGQGAAPYPRNTCGPFF